MNPKISVLLPVYNCESYVGAAIESILIQTFPNFELLIIDDASLDKTLDIILAFNDSRIRLLCKPSNTGYIESLNKGLEIAKGQYIARMDADDISFPNRFEEQLAILESDASIGLCCANYQIIDETGNIKSGKYWNSTPMPIVWQLLWENPVAHPTVMFRAALLQKHSVFYNRAKHPAEDYDMWCRLALLTKMYRLDEALLYYRVHGGSEFQKNRERAYKNALESLNSLTISLTGKPTPDVHIAQSVFKHLKGKGHVLSPVRYLDWLNELLQHFVNKAYFTQADIAAIKIDIRIRYQLALTDSLTNLETFSITRLKELYLSRGLYFLRLPLRFQVALMAKCIVGYFRKLSNSTRSFEEDQPKS